ncbi:hypothetical protein BD324DRAFT_650453 [Kockovaella imperatae]|uniref:Uncharacterized protein n=1 Tax=Kockovaella imperatae TaxID=4999 RepID=A0A1Y1UIU9_9TREE|nr:hypothetical protein BD324DRAFT_650453 [Kockovaella imperatae]ORX37912.1 hypothetical protein BD324DRAFT_650453 [Kockovaella imperatae]
MSLKEITSEKINIHPESTTAASTFGLESPVNILYAPSSFWVSISNLELSQRGRASGQTGQVLALLTLPDLVEDLVDEEGNHEASLLLLFPSGDEEWKDETRYDGAFLFDPSARVAADIFSHVQDESRKAGVEQVDFEMGVKSRLFAVTDEIDLSLSLFPNLRAFDLSEPQRDPLSDNYLYRAFLLPSTIDDEGRRRVTEITGDATSVTIRPVWHRADGSVECREENSDTEDTSPQATHESLSVKPTLQSESRHSRRGLFKLTLEPAEQPPDWKLNKSAKSSGSDEAVNRGSGQVTRKYTFGLDSARRAKISVRS